MSTPPDSWSQSVCSSKERPMLPLTQLAQPKFMSGSTDVTKVQLPASGAGMQGSTISNVQCLWTTGGLLQAIKELHPVASGPIWPLIDWEFNCSPMAAQGEQLHTAYLWQLATLCMRLTDVSWSNTKLITAQLCLQN